MKKHKLEGYCIRGGKEIADRIRKVFEADGVIEKNLALSETNTKYFIGNTGYVEFRGVESSCERTLITIEEAERIVFGEPENTFPRMMEVSDDGVKWDECIVHCQLKGVEWPYITGGLDGEYNGYKHAREIQPEPSTEITDEVMIKAVHSMWALLRNKYDFSRGLLFTGKRGEIRTEDGHTEFEFNSIPELIKHLRDEK